jgi:hypothetical protein
MIVASEMRPYRISDLKSQISILIFETIVFVLALDNEQETFVGDYRRENGAGFLGATTCL